MRNPHGDVSTSIRSEIFQASYVPSKRILRSGRILVSILCFRSLTLHCILYRESYSRSNGRKEIAQGYLNCENLCPKYQVERRVHVHNFPIIWKPLLRSDRTMLILINMCTVLILFSALFLFLYSPVFLVFLFYLCLCNPSASSMPKIFFRLIRQRSDAYAYM